jgi:hypothetical protein
MKAGCHSMLEARPEAADFDTGCNVLFSAIISSTGSCQVTTSEASVI